MTQRIKFAPDFIKNYDGTPEQLLSLISTLEKMLHSDEDLDNLASSITYNSNSFDKVLSINI